MPNPPSSANPRHRPLRLLIVDDMPQVRQDLRGLLELYEEVVVVGEAVNGLDAIRKVGVLRPDVVVMDMEMPEMDGCEATLKIKEQSLAVKVIILTIHSGSMVEKRIREAGADAYVQKGTSYEVLIHAILQEK